MPVALYRKWRPQTFEEVVGQEHIVITLQNSLKYAHIGHAYLFAGPRGTGKTTVARILAKALNCAKGPTPTPCLKCESCVEIAEGRSIDVIEIDAASNRGIDEIRDIREKARLLPVRDRYKIYIIDEVHMLTNEAFNALLKILEEPPEHVIFIMATTEPQKVPLTILSRCQRFDFRRLTRDEIIKQLAKIAESEGAKISEGALRLIAIQSQGSMRDAISLLEQLLVYSDQEITEDFARNLLGLPTYEFTYKFAKALGEYNILEGYSLLQQVFQMGKNPQQFARELLQHFRNLLLLKADERIGNLLSITQEEFEELMEETKLYTMQRLQDIIDQLLILENRLRDLTNAPLVMEMILLPLFMKEETVEAQIIQTPTQPTTPIKTEEKEEKEKRGESTPGTLNIDELLDKWPQLLAKIKKRKISLEAMLREARIIEIDQEGKLVLGLPKNFSFLKERLEEKPNRALIEEEFKKLYGVPIQVKFITVEENPILKNPEKEDPKKEEKKLSTDDVKNMFKGKLIE
ncbi:MAG: DNA polymerase III subunit gamma/tau [Dictyoglomus turgidum]|uniref:DNA polymerase III subunit gamma/tau n=1 Tax=Dictyoglomus turgidum TaxID=513050 RepID=UPI003C73EC0F